MRVAKLEQAALLLQPFLFAAGALFSQFSSLTTSADSLIRPMVVTLVLVALCLFVVGLTSRNWAWASMMTSSVALFTLRDQIFALLLAICAWWVLIGLLRRARASPPPNPAIIRSAARASGIFGVAYCVVMGWSAWSAVERTVPDLDFPSYELAGEGGPNIYLIMLDGYPRLDTLRDQFRIDNEAFEDDLQGLGFHIAEGARSNYNKTWTTLASVLNGTYVESMMGDHQVPTSGREQIRWLHSMIEKASMLDGLRDRGYIIRSIPGNFRSTALVSSDDFIDHGHLTEFEGNLISYSPWAILAREPVRDFLATKQEETITDAMTTLVGLTQAEATAPQFVFAHIPSPHTPFVLHAADEPRPPLPDCVPGECSFWSTTIQDFGMDLADYRDGLETQLTALNDMVLATLSQIVSADPEAVILVFSDHGIRYSLDDIPEHYRSFLATRTPGVERLYPDDESPVNLLRRLFEMYFNAATPALPYEAWFSPWTEALSLVPLQTE